MNVRLAREDLDDAPLVHEVDPLYAIRVHYQSAWTTCAVSFDMTSKIERAHPTDEMVTCLWCAVGRWQ